MKKPSEKLLAAVKEATEDSLYILAAKDHRELLILGVYTTREAGLASLEVATEDLGPDLYHVDLFTVHKSVINQPYLPDSMEDYEDYEEDEL